MARLQAMLEAGAKLGSFSQKHPMSKPELLFLPSLSLQGNRIGQSGAKMISDAIRTNAPDCIVEV